MLALLATALAAPLATPTVSVWIDATGAYRVSAGDSRAAGPPVPSADLAGAMTAAGAGDRVRIHADPLAPLLAVAYVNAEAASVRIPHVDLVTTEPAEGVTLMPVNATWPTRTPPDLEPPFPAIIELRPEGVRGGRRDTVAVGATGDAITEAALQALYRDHAAHGWDPAVRDLVVNGTAEVPMGPVLRLLEVADQLGYYWPAITVYQGPLPEVATAWTDKPPPPAKVPDLSVHAPPPDYTPERRGALGGSVGESGGLGSLGGPDGDIVILGALDRAQIEAAVAPVQRTLDACVAQVHGKVVVKFVVEKRGNVSSATVKSSTVGNAEAEACVVAEFRKLRFPKLRGGGIATVSYGVVAE